MRYLYSFLLYLIAPFIPLYLKKRASKNPSYGMFWHERFGFKLVNNSVRPIIWIHAVSVGETRAMVKLVGLLEEQYPGHQLLITQMTPTGRDTAKTLYPNAIFHYLPYDMPHGVLNFYTTFKPKLGLIMETEIWPNLIHYAYKKKIPLYLINARLSVRSFKAYNKVKWMIRPILNKFNGILCQDQNSADNFKNLGFVKTLQIIGNTKFDIVVEEKYFELAKFLKQKLINKKVVIFASTRAGEEKLIIDKLPDSFDYLVIIVPRHPERFFEVEQLIKRFKYQKRSDNKPIEMDTQILLGNSLGEMFAYYTLADLAVIGGSFVDLGGQNLIEPIYLNKPVVFGPSMFNFAEIAKNALNDKCAVQVKDAEECFQIIEQLFKTQENYNTLMANCAAFISRYQGASQAILDLIKPSL